MSLILNAFFVLNECILCTSIFVNPYNKDAALILKVMEEAIVVHKHSVLHSYCMVRTLILLMPARVTC